MIDHLVQGQEAGNPLLSLCQGLASVASFSVDFYLLPVESGWDDKPLWGDFVQGLSEKFKDEQATHDESESL